MLQALYTSLITFALSYIAHNEQPEAFLWG
jgi:hypothetical protein